MSPERDRNREHTAGFTGPDVSEDPFAAPTLSTTEQDVEVIHGVYAQTFPLGGMSVRRARSELADRMNIDPEAVAVVNGDEVDEDTILTEGQVLNFVKHSGEKG